MLRVIELEHLIYDESLRISDELLKIAKRGGSEENVRLGCSNLIEEFIKKSQLKLTGDHEFILKNGRIDSKYGGVIIEYKKSGTITEDYKSNTNAVIEQLTTRFKDFKTQKKADPEKIFGVGTDASTFVFVRMRGKDIVVSDPVDTNPHTVEKFLRALVSAGAIGKTISPDNLATDFGGDTDISSLSIKNIYLTLIASKHNKVKTYFRQWKLLFSQVGGFDHKDKESTFEKLAEFYGVYGKNIDSARLLFSIHTYYDLIIKLLTSELSTSSEGISGSFIKKLATAPIPRIYDIMKELEEGGVWSQLGIKNFLEGDLFSWYLADWNDKIGEVVHKISSKLDEYDPSSLSGETAEKQDLLKSLFQQLFPKKLRHDLGEYYTPDWLAEFVLDELGYDGNPDKRLLDPACGSGTFLVCAIKRVREWYDKNRFQVSFGPGELLEKITENIIGFDLNPMAVIAARANYLFVVANLVRHVGEIEIPIYMCDSIMRPSEQSTLFEGDIKLETALEGVEFAIPREASESIKSIENFSSSIEFCIKNKYSVENFIKYCKDMGFEVAKSLEFEVMYKQMQELDEKDMNGIWARIIKNAFAPLFIRKVDFIAGNPPWINWESLPDGYRSSESHQGLWNRYGLFTLSASAARLGGGKKDLSMLMTYVAVDEYLKEGGKLGFIITQSVFKTKGAGDGFRRLKFEEETNGKEYTYLSPLRVHDLSDFQCFEGTTNRASIFIAQKTKEPFDYPVPYTIWKKTSRARIGTKFTLGQAKRNTRRYKLQAEPVNKKETSSPWLTAPRKALRGIKKVIGQSDYKGYAGTYTGGLNGAYWIKILQEIHGGDLLVENLGNVGKKKVDVYQRRVESDLVYPLLRGRDVKRWNAEPSCHIILSQNSETRKGIDVQIMQRKYPKTYAYLRLFEKQLWTRQSSFIRTQMEKGPFYSMFAVGPYTMSPWKVVWREQSKKFISCVTGSVDKKLILPDHKLMFIPCGEKQEAHYLSAVLNSSPSSLTIQSYVISIQTSTHILQNVSIPKFDPNNKTHEQLAKLSQECHKSAKKDDQENISKLEGEIDKLASKLWGITDSELLAIQQAIQEM